MEEEKKIDNSDNIISKNEIKISENINSNKNNNNDTNNEYKTKIGFDLKYLKNLSKKELFNLVIFINNSCFFTLKDKKYIDSIHNIFKIVKNIEKNFYEIITLKNIQGNEENKKIEDKKIEDKKESNLHQINLPISCSQHNNMKFDTVKQYISHCKETHKEFICFVCQKKFENFTPMKKHIYKMFNIGGKHLDKDNNKNNNNINSEKEEIKCIECSKTFKTTEAVINHFYATHDKEIKDESKKKDLENKFNKWIENRINQNKEKEEIDKAIEDILKNNDLPKKNKKPKEEKEKEKEKKDNKFIPKDNKHISKDLKKNDDNKNLDLYYCEICDKYFNSKDAKDQHWKIKGHDNEVFCCKICNKYFNTQEAKEQHCKLKKHIEIFFCKVCNKIFNSKDAKETHCKMKNHNEIFCKICKKTFNSEEAKDEHCKVKKHFK